MNYANLLPNQDPSSVDIDRLLGLSTIWGRTTEDIVKQLPYATNDRSAAKLIAI